MPTAAGGDVPLRPLVPVCVAFGRGAPAPAPRSRSPRRPLLLALAAPLLGLAWPAPRAGRLGPSPVRRWQWAPPPARVERIAYDRTPLRGCWPAQAEEAPPVRVDRRRRRRDSRERGDRWTLVVDVGSDRGRPERVKAVRGRARDRRDGRDAHAGDPRGRPRRASGHSSGCRAASGTPGGVRPAAEARRQGVHALGYCKSAQLVETGGPAGRNRLARRAAARARAPCAAGADRARAARAGARPRARDGAGRPPGGRRRHRGRLPRGGHVSRARHLGRAGGAPGGAPGAGSLARARAARRCPAAVLLSLALLFYAELVGGRRARRARDGDGRSCCWPAGPSTCEADVVNLLALAGAACCWSIGRRPSATWASSSRSRRRSASSCSRRGCCSGWPRCRCESRSRSRLRSPPRSRCCRCWSCTSIASLAGRGPAEPGGGARSPRPCWSRALLVLAGGRAGARPRAAAWATLAWIAAHALLRSALAVRAFPRARRARPGAAGLGRRVCRDRPAAAAWRGRALPRGPLLAGRRRVGLRLRRGARGGRPPARHAARRRAGRRDPAAVPARPRLAGRRRRRVRRRLRRGGGRRRSRTCGRAACVASTGVLVTHAHPDHAGGVPVAARGLRGRRGLGGTRAATGPGLSRCSTTALREARVARRRRSAAVTRDEWDGVAIEVLGPRVVGPAALVDAQRRLGRAGGALRPA